MISRFLKLQIQNILKSKSLLLLGPRQVGKSTLLKSLNPDLTINLSEEKQYLAHLKDPDLISRICLSSKKNSFIFIDEIQRIPSLMNTIQYLIDENPHLKFALSGSSARKLNKGKANLLPGRVIFEKLYSLTYWELSEDWTEDFLNRCLTSGSLPGVFNSDLGNEILESYVEIYLKEEIKAEALTRDIAEYANFLDLAAELSGQYTNYAKISSESEIDKDRIRRYMQILEDTLLIHRIEAYGTLNAARKARQKDKFIFFDIGVRNAILKKHKSTFTPTELGPLFESWIGLQLISLIQYTKNSWKLTTYRDDRNLEIDYILETQHELILIEVKYQKKYRKEFAQHLNLFESLIKTNKKVKKLIIYTGHLKQKDDDQIEILPYTIFLDNLLKLK